MYSEEYRPVIEELYRTDSCLFRLNHTPPRSDEQRRALEELFCGQVPQGPGSFLSGGSPRLIALDSTGRCC